jgi:putative MATE family efflux protein
MTPELKETTKRLGDAPLGRLLISLSLPGMASMIAMTLYNIIDTFWVARLGYQAIAALTIVLPYHVLIIAIGSGSGIGINALTSRRFGERNVEATHHIAGQAFTLSALLGVIFLLSAVFMAKPILTICGATPDIIGLATQYLNIIGLGIPFVFFMIMSGNLLRGSGDAVRPMIFMITASVANIILDPFLIFGYGPFPEMGVRGAALATIIAQALGAGLSLGYILAGKSAYQAKLKHLKPDLKVLKDIYRVGLPSMILEIGESIIFALFNYVISGFGSLALAAVGITIRIADLVWMPMFGISQGLLPIVGFSFGARLWKRLWRAVKLASIGIMLLTGIALISVEILAPQLIAIFNDDPELMAIAVPAMRIFMSTIVIVGPSILFITTFQGLSKGKEAMILTLIRQFVFFVPLLFLLPRIWGISGVWWSMPISDTLSTIISGLWLFREYKMQQKTGVWSDTPVPETNPEN